MKLSIDNFSDGEMIPGEFAFCTPDPVQHVAMSDNKNPGLSWSDAPKGTKSFVLLCVDVDVPSNPDDVNQEDREVLQQVVVRMKSLHMVNKTQSVQKAHAKASTITLTGLMATKPCKDNTLVTMALAHLGTIALFITIISFCMQPI